jgi:hypothetical protein
MKRRIIIENVALARVVMAAAMVLIGQAAWAGAGSVIVLPMGPGKPKSGLTVKIDGRGVEGNGYRPLRVEVTPWPVKPLAADRQIRIEINPPRFGFSRPTPIVSQVIELPEGSTSVTATILVPQSSSWNAIAVDIYEGGEWLEDLSVIQMGWANGGTWDLTEARPAMLFIDSDVPARAARDKEVQTYRRTVADPLPTYELPDVRHLSAIFHDPNMGMSVPQLPALTAALTSTSRISDTALLSFVDGLPRVEMLPPAETPQRWIELSQYDTTFISLDDLKLLAEKHSQVLGAVREWMSTGPLLVVYGAGENFEHLAEVERLLALPVLPIAGSGKEEYRGWEPPDPKVQRDNLLSPFELGTTARAVQVGPGRFRRVTSNQVMGADALASETEKGASGNAAGKTPFLMRPAGLGCVVAVGSTDPFVGKETDPRKLAQQAAELAASAAAGGVADPLSVLATRESDWVWMFNATPEAHWRWFRRNGFSLRRANDDYWELLIPGVGEAPVWSFLLLVSLFAIVIGPVNYFLLDRSRRLYLLLITVPAGATVVTVCLFGYALFTDGFGVRLRARSFTELDQRAGQAAVWSRQSYYAGIAPGQGLVFPADTTVFPIVAEPEWSPGGLGAMSGRLAWRDEQHLEAGYLSSRTATQFMVQRATKSEARLVVREGSGTQRVPGVQGSGPQVENRLEAHVRYLLLRDRGGAYFSTRDLAANATAMLSPIDPAAAEKELHQLADAVAPSFPGDEARFNNSIMRMLMPQRRGFGGDSAAGDPMMETSLLESQIAAATSPWKQPLAPGTYVAVTERCPAVPIGVPKVREEASLHVVRGRY